MNIVALVANSAQAEDLDVYAELPDPSPDPVMQVEENGEFGQSSHMPDALTEYEIECQTWALTKQSALDLVDNFTGVLRDHPSNAHGQVSKMRRISNSYERDPKRLVNGQPGPRYITLFRIWARPA